MTFDQVEARRQKAINFARNVLRDDDLADSIEDESTEDYASRKHLVIKNTANHEARKATMANGDTKADLQDTIDAVTDILSGAYTPESSREDLAAAVGDALDALSGDGGDDDDDDAGDDLDDDGDTYSDAG